MANYTKIVDYAAKDALNTGDPVKLVKGTELGAEYDAIAVAIATKANTASPAFTGVSSFAVGAVGAPSIYMTGYATTGWYNIGANNWGFAVSGAKVLDISSTGLAVTGTLNSTGQISKTNSAATNTVFLDSLTTTTGANGFALTNTGGNTFIGLENSAGTYQGGTAYDTMVALPAGRGFSTVISGTGTVTRTTSTGLAVTGALTCSTGFGANGNAAQTKYTVNAASTDLATVVALCNQLRAALIANGICV